MTGIYDGHIHTPYCPHGSADPLTEYIERAIQLGYRGMTFTEHAPLPEGFTDPVPDNDSAMEMSRLPAYLDELTSLKKYYNSALTLNIGLEVDYIEGWENETRTFLDEFGPRLDDAVLSVHFLKQADHYYCLDYSEEMFGKIAAVFGSTDQVHLSYYRTLAQSITSDLGKYKPKRIGHMTLVNKFQALYPTETSFDREIQGILQLVKTYGLELDYNGAGLSKPFCKEPYPPDWVIEAAVEQEIPLVYGSDAHSVKGLGQGLDSIIHTGSLTVPLFLNRSE
ncbi:histidinol-phosphatase HisJ [Fictibacillus sp. S7]|uniref:histidinol-phosphatase HisJ n=1 Tax=Fictibacillus sp. S7 TaxID=2212476 RepID=UPI0019D706B9|nr:histidinol-phosphatase HisJ [Fictibacillus sp. S7]